MSHMLSHIMGHCIMGFIMTSNDEEAEAKGKANARAMAHEERVKKAAVFRNSGLALIVSGVVLAFALIMAFWNTMKSIAILLAISAVVLGCSLGCSMNCFNFSIQMQKWDKEFMQSGYTPNERV